MDSGKYLEGVLATESNDFDAIRERMGDDSVLRLLHAAIGVATESGEILDQLKKHLFYGKPLDRRNLFEEFGDVLWYVGVGLSALATSFAEAMAANARKLAARYKGKFSAEAALERDVKKEMTALDGGKESC